MPAFIGIVLFTPQAENPVAIPFDIYIEDPFVLPRHNFLNCDVIVNIINFIYNYTIYYLVDSNE